MMVRAVFVRDIRSSTPGSCAALASRCCLVGVVGPELVPSYRLHPRADQLRQAFEVQGPADQIGLLANAIEPSATEAPEPVPILAFAKELLDLLAAPLRELVAAAPPSHPDARMRRCRPRSAAMWGAMPRASKASMNAAA